MILVLGKQAMKKQTAIALMIVRMGPLQQSLQTLLTTLPEIKIVAEARDISALETTAHELQPDLILLDMSLATDSMEATLAYIKQTWSRVSCIVLVETAVQRKTAVAAGADVVLFKGYRAAQLITIIEDLLAAETTDGQTAC